MSTYGRDRVEESDCFRPFPPKADRPKPTREGGNPLLLLVKGGRLEPRSSEVTPQALNKGLPEGESQETRFVKTEGVSEFLQALAS